MTSLADRTIEALAAEHDKLTNAVRELSSEQLAAPSAAAEWSVAQVLSHVGSGAEITLAGLQTALGQRPAPDDGFNRAVWDRWDAMSPEEQRAGALEHDAELVAALTALDATQRRTLELQVGFGPGPLTVAEFTGVRLHEAAQHGWDVRAAADPAAELDAASAQVLADLFCDGLGFLLGFIGKPESITEPTRLEIAGSGYALSITDTVTMVTPVNEPTATFSGPLEAAIRLIAGRLGPAYTPADLEVTGNITLEELRTVFPGF